MSLQLVQIEAICVKEGDIYFSNFRKAAFEITSINHSSSGEITLYHGEKVAYYKTHNKGLVNILINTDNIKINKA